MYIDYFGNIATPKIDLSRVYSYKKLTMLYLKEVFLLPSNPLLIMNEKKMFLE